MRRRLSFMICLLLCALAVSGWGGVLAAALCPHGMRATAAPQRMKEHATCHAESVEAVAHHSASKHEAMDDMAMDATPQTKEESRSLASPSESCQHCIGHSNLPGASVNPRESQPNGRESNHAAAEDVRRFAPPVVRFVAAVLPVQGAPPGQAVARHLLLNTFII